MGVAQDKLNAIGSEQVAEWIADGRSYREIARTAEVGLGSLCMWIDAEPERSHACARARETSAQAFEDQAQEYIHDAADQFELSKAKELAIHLRWRAKVNNPRRYGERTTIAGDPDAPLNPRPLAGVSDQELDAALARLGLGDAKPG